ncbi:MAG: hypothetical protein KBS52_04080 [Clostridiales bacterium]|nr:hypothetical protein [Candidatus Equinaster intestinalis]
MIKLIDSLPSYGKTDLPLVRIHCNFAAYGNFPKIALFWAQTDEKGKVTALLCMIDGSLTVTENGADTDELREFISALGARDILCSKELAEKIGFEIFKICTVLRADPPHKTENAIENTGEGVNRLYEMLKNDFELEKEAFLADVSHRVRHNCAFFVTSPFAAGLCLYSEKFALINGICTLKEKRGTHIGSAVLARIKSGIRQKPLFVASQNADNFYLKNNFTVCGQAAYCKGI